MRPGTASFWAPAGVHDEKSKETPTGVFSIRPSLSASAWEWLGLPVVLKSSLEPDHAGSGSAAPSGP